VTEYSALPHGVAVFPGDAGVRRIAEREHKVVHWSEFDRGGRFATTEGPDLLVTDIRAFFRLVRRPGPCTGSAAALAADRRREVTGP
jgi:hypothetical protein